MYALVFVPLGGPLVVSGIFLEGPDAIGTLTLTPPGRSLGPLGSPQSRWPRVYLGLMLHVYLSVDANECWHTHLKGLDSHH